MTKEYLTVEKAGEIKFEEKKSLFIASYAPVMKEEDAVDFLARIKIKYPDANHHVYAYVIGRDNLIQRSSDGGEPQGTGGKPILDSIKKAGIEDVMIVVSRYFGGVLLGAGGLIRAYGKSAQLAIADAKIIKKVLCQKAQFSLDYNLWGKLQNLLGGEGYEIDEVTYTEQVNVTSFVETEKMAQFQKIIADLTNGACQAEFGDTSYVDRDRE